MRRNYEWKLLQEITRRNYYRKLLASISMTWKMWDL